VNKILIQNVLKLFIYRLLWLWVIIVLISHNVGIVALHVSKFFYKFVDEL